jgi:nitrogen fixation NifU-like protein
MSIDELYQEVLTYHSQHPCNRDYPMSQPSHAAECKNPLCGDIVKLHIRISEGKIDDIAFGGSGCVISQSAASMLTEAVKGKDLAQVQRIGAALDEALGVPRQQAVSDEVLGKLGDLKALLGVRQFPVRKKCALLAWKTLQLALSGDVSSQPSER